MLRATAHWVISLGYVIVFTQVLDSFYVTQLLCNPVLDSQTGQNQTHFSGHCIVFLRGIFSNEIKVYIILFSYQTSPVETGKCI